MERCRIWWPRQQRQPELEESVSTRYVMFGWLFPHAGSVDIVVSAFVSEGEILRSFPSLDTLQVSHGSITIYNTGIDGAFKCTLPSIPFILDSIRV
jgi:hypothetical protein